MKEHSSRGNSQNAFTLTELLVVIAMVALMAALAVPALAHSKIKSPAAVCINNLRQIMTGWLMYEEDNNDNLMLNAPSGASGGWITDNSAENWGNDPGNTNVASLRSGAMAPYVGNDVRVFKCPADVVPSANGQRLRSISMNSQLGTFQNYNTGWRTYTKGSDLTCPSPANAFVFCDEHPGTLNDGFLQMDFNAPDFPDMPASYHGNACGFGFADGHAEEHRWITPAMAIPVKYGVTFVYASAGGASADYVWLTQHAACKHR